MEYADQEQAEADQPRGGAPAKNIANPAKREQKKERRPPFERHQIVKDKPAQHQRHDLLGESFVLNTVKAHDQKEHPEFSGND